MNLSNPTPLSAEALERLLLYGTQESRNRLAGRIAASGYGLAGQLEVLSETARSGAPALLRARCVELLELVRELVEANAAADP